MVVVTTNSHCAGVAACGGYASVSGGDTSRAGHYATGCCITCWAAHGSASSDSAVRSDGGTAYCLASISTLNTTNPGYAAIGTNTNRRCSGIAAWTSHRDSGGLATAGTFGGPTIDIKVIASCSLRGTGTSRSAQAA